MQLPRNSPSNLPSPAETSPDTPISNPKKAVDQDALPKKWNIPPRPKPGRKPSTNMPPSKRKAQNRDAQRAFRERRAAREDELKEEQGNERKQWHIERQQMIDTFTDRQRCLQQALSTEVAASESLKRSASEESARAQKGIRDRDHEISRLRSELQQLQAHLSNSSRGTNHISGKSAIS